MSATTSAATGRCFGIHRPRHGLERSRSALYAQQTRALPHAWARGRRGENRRRGHRTRSCWRRFGPISRGPRSTAKAIARSTHVLRILDGIRVARTRVLRVMRAHELLSPHRGRQVRQEEPLRERQDSGAQRDVGDGRRAGIHARRPMGLDLRGSRSLERVSAVG